MARGEPVYGINTGFGKLASVRIAAADLETLQRNIVLAMLPASASRMPRRRRAADDGAEARQPGAGASGVRLETLELLEAMLAKDVIPVIPGQGSVGASGDLAPLAHMTAAMIGVGECFTHHGRMPAAVAFVAAGLEPVKLGAKEGLALINGTQFSTA